MSKVYIVNYTSVNICFLITVPRQLKHWRLSAIRKLCLTSNVCVPIINYLLQL